MKLRLTFNPYEVNYPKFRAEAARGLEKMLLGVCPQCRVVTNGEQLVQVYRIREGMRTKVGLFVAAELSKGIERLLAGKCGDSNCDFEEILVFWRPSEDKRLTNRLAKMGIKI